jgi:hypothetical protein
MTSVRAVKRSFGKVTVALLIMLLCSASLAAPVRAVTAANDAYSTNEDTAVNCTVLTNDTGTGLVVDSVGTCGNGTATIVPGGGSITYTPNANWSGTDSFTYTVREPGTPYYSVNSHYYEFVASTSIRWDTAKTEAEGRHLYGLHGYLVTITDAGEQAFVQTKLAGSTGWMGASDAAVENEWRWVTGPEVNTLFSNGGVSGGGHTNVLYDNWDANEPNNQGGTEDYAHFLPAGLSAGEWNDYAIDTSVAGYVVEYGGMPGDAAEANVFTATVTVTVNAVNDAPSFTKGGDQTFAEDSGARSIYPWATGISAGSSDESSQTVHFDVSNSNNSLFSAQPAVSSIGALTFTPRLNQNGSATVTVQIHDDGGTANGGVDTSAPQTFSITISEVNDPPIVTNDSFTFAEDATITLNALDPPNSSDPADLWNLLRNDLEGPSDSNESAQTLQITSFGSKVRCDVDMTDGIITVHPDHDYYGAASFTYTICDNGTTDGVLDTRYATGTVNLTITSVPDIADDTATTDEDTAKTISVLANDTFEGSPVVTAVSLPSHGAAVINTGTTVTYTPVADYNGGDSFTYTVTSPAGVTETATVTMTITAVEDITNDTATTAEDTAKTISVLANDTFEGSPVVTSVGAASHGAVVINTADNPDTVTYTPVADYNGTDSFTYTVTSPAGVTETATVTMTITAVADIVADSVTTNEDAAITFNAITGTNGASADNFENPLRYISAVTQGAHSVTVAFLADGSITYTPVANWNGADSFTYTVTSPPSTTPAVIETATVTITVTPVNDPPVNTTLPVVSGSPYVGEALTATTGTWNDLIDTAVSGNSTLSYTYQWLRARDVAGRGLVLIVGATASAYSIDPMDEGMYVAVRITCTDDGVGLPLHQSTSADSAFLQVPKMGDTMSPTITLPDFSSWPGVIGWSRGTTQTFTVGSSPFPLQFTLEDGSGSAKWTIKVNGIIIVDPVGSGLITYPVPLSEGRNDIEISASDAVGNRVMQTLVIYLDSMGPVLTIEPALPSSVTTPRLTIAGSVVDAISGLKWVSINGTAVVPFMDGSFRETLTLTKGVNKIIIEAEDKVGHKTSTTYTVTYATVLPPLPSAKTITLTIGKTVMDVNGMTVALDAAPVIKESRTMLPIRAIAEAISASVEWDPVTKKVTITRGSTRIELWIGKSIAKLNGEAVSIDAANSKVVPYITNGRTLLPVRFIAEALGLDVEWNASTRVVKLTLRP